MTDEPNLPSCTIKVDLFDPEGKYIRGKKAAFEFKNETFKTNYEIMCQQLLWSLATGLEDADK